MLTRTLADAIASHITRIYNNLVALGPEPSKSNPDSYDKHWIAVDKNLDPLEALPGITPFIEVQRGQVYVGLDVYYADDGKLEYATLNITRMEDDLLPYIYLHIPIGSWVTSDDIIVRCRAAIFDAGYEYSRSYSDDCAKRLLALAELLFALR